MTCSSTTTLHWWQLFWLFFFKIHPSVLPPLFSLYFFLFWWKWLFHFCNELAMDVLLTSSSSILRIMTTWHKTPLISRQRAWQYQLLFVIVYIFLFCWENIIEPKLRRVTKCKLRHTVILIWSWETEFSLLFSKMWFLFFSWKKKLVRCVLKKHIVLLFKFEYRQLRSFRSQRTTFKEKQQSQSFPPSLI